MARLNAPRPVVNSPGSRPDREQQDKPSDTQNKGWPFAKGSQNKLDETQAPLAASVIPARDASPWPYAQVKGAQPAQHPAPARQ